MTAPRAANRAAVGAAVLGLVWAGGVAAQPAAGPPAARCEMIDGRILTGDLVGVDTAGAVRMSTADGVTAVPLVDVHRLELGEPPTGGDPPPATVWLRSGLELPAAIAAADRAGVRVSLPFVEEPFELAWRHVRAVLLAAGPADPGFLAKIGESVDGDLLYAVDEGGLVRRFTVQFAGIDGDSIEVRFGGTERRMPLQRVHGVVLGDRSGARPDPQPRPVVELVVRDGSLVRGKLLGLDAAAAEVRLDEGATLRVPRDRIGVVRVQSDKLRQLTDLPPTAEQTPAFDMTWPWLRNRGLGGGPIRLGGATYGSGYVLFPRTRLTWDIDDGFDVFAAVIGMEDRASDRANAVFRVLGDGRVLFDSGPVTARAEPRAIEVPVAGVRRLSVEADFGEGFDLGDACVFAAPRVLRRS